MPAEEQATPEEKAAPPKAAPAVVAEAPGECSHLDAQGNHDPVSHPHDNARASAPPAPPHHEIAASECDDHPNLQARKSVVRAFERRRSSDFRPTQTTARRGQDNHTALPTAPRAPSPTKRALQLSLTANGVRRALRIARKTGAPLARPITKHGEPWLPLSIVMRMDSFESVRGSVVQIWCGRKRQVSLCRWPSIRTVSTPRLRSKTRALVRALSSVAICTWS
eukprot:SAG11_NODE_5208_length_1630_cov_1.578707_1_plen_223_part_00